MSQSGGSQSDLIALVADRNMDSALCGILGRIDSLSIRSTNFDIYVHPEKDPGCLLRSHDFLRSFTRRYAHALVMFDRDGCGGAGASRDELEMRVESQLTATGWAQRSAAVVIEPELESWVWSDSPHVSRALGWGSAAPPLRRWLTDHNFWPSDQLKPTDPKAAMEAALRHVNRPRSSAIYQSLAKHVSFARCADPAFAKLTTTLQRWFAV